MHDKLHKECQVSVVLTRKLSFLFLGAKIEKLVFKVLDINQQFFLKLWHRCLVSTVYLERKLPFSGPPLEVIFVAACILNLSIGRSLDNIRNLSR